MTTNDPAAANKNNPKMFGGIATLAFFMGFIAIGWFGNEAHVALHQKQAKKVDCKAMADRIDKDFRAYMRKTYPQLKEAPPGMKYQPDYDIWIGKNWKKYPGFWECCK